MTNSEYENIYFTSASPPSYLRELGIEEDLMLVYLKSNASKEELISTEGQESFKIEINDSLDLTGSPLEVDLDGDESLLSPDKNQYFHLWTEQEESHFPLDLKKARWFINLQFKVKHNEGNPSKPIYVICDGNNVESTVVLGAQKEVNFLMSTKVNILGYLLKDHESLSLEEMVKTHKLNTRVEGCKINYVTKFKTFMYGTYLQKTNSIHASEMYGSICMESICQNKCAYDAPQNLLNSRKMILQVIVGHPLSSVHFLWKDLCLLQHFLDILSSADQYDDGETSLSPDPLVVSNIYKEINSALGFNFLKKEQKMDFSLSNIRVETILDKLWDILKCCENLADLRESFHYFFEELTIAEMITPTLLEKDDSLIATIVSGILKGKMAVPTVTFSQALEFLFELGTEKLRKDYQTIVKHFNINSESAISLKWSQLRNKLTLQDGMRKTRVTLSQKRGKMDISHNTTKLAYLGRMHLAVDFIYLVDKEINLPEETFDYFCEKVCKTYIEKEPKTFSDFSDLRNSQINDFEISVEVAEQKLKKVEIPTTWSLKMTSLTNDMEVTTLYHLCQHPIFPTTVYNNYDVTNINKEDCTRFYVCKLERYKNLL